MYNYALQSGKRVIDKYRDGASKLYDLCDYINKKALLWYSLKIEFSLDEVELITRMQQTMEEMSDIAIDIAKNEIRYENLDLDYEIYCFNCPKCNGALRVIDFLYNGFGHEFNKYKCIECGKEFTDELPNDSRLFERYFEIHIDKLNSIISSEFAKEKDVIKASGFLEKLMISQIKSKTIDKNVLKTNEMLKESVLTIIEKNGGLYKEFIKLKHHFDVKN